MPRRTLAVLFALVTLWSLAGAGTRATYGARTTADEPQYLLSAISLVEDGDLDVADELADERWRDFHRVELPRQTEPRPDGSELSPHDPLLPVLLVPGIVAARAVDALVPGDWQHTDLAGARLVLALVAGALAAVLAWTATERLGVGRRSALLVVGGFALAAPFAAYGHQLYPELPAALAVAVAAAALLPAPGRPAGAAIGTAATVTWVAAVVALPWLGVKYAPVAVALALVGLVGSGGRRRAAVGGLAVAGLAYLALHQGIYGGWTVYAAGDHFVGGELTVVGEDPDHLGRTVRLLGLLVDRDFGLVAWAPAWLLAVPAVTSLLRRRDRTTATLVLPLAAGWATATWVALTMHGWWWPGRQTVVVLPLAVLAVARFVHDHPRTRPVVLAASVLGAATWAWLVVEATVGDLRLIVDFDATANPWLRAWRSLLPDERVDGVGTAVGNVAWGLVLVALAVAGWRAGGQPAGGGPDRPASAGGDQDALAGEGADAHDVAGDLDRGRPVGR